MPRKVFVAGEILTAADVNTNLMDQAVMVFDDDAARTTAIPTPVEGMVTYLKDEDEVTVFDGSAFKAVGPGKILQVVSTAKTDAFSSSSTTFTDITGLTVSITPTSASSKILVSVVVTGNADPSQNTFFLQLVRDSTAIALGDAASNRSRVTNMLFNSSASVASSAAIQFLDSPNSTSALTYKMQGRTNGAGSFVVNRGLNDTDQAVFGRTVSSITVMEVAG